ncbi:putative glycosyl hydrolase family 61 protein 1 [Elsinoe fawcettii]|nr:putative glycosyl hydrolase family 61 protein 1 [Elsinoe fawcettii]
MAALLAVALLTTQCLGHTLFQEVFVNGVSEGLWKGVRRVEIHEPLYNISSPDFICNSPENNNGNPIAPAPDMIHVNGGDNITTGWYNMPTGRNVSNDQDPIAKSHKGSVVVYMAPTWNPRSPNVENLKWIKVFQDGIDTNGTTAVDRLRANGGKVDFQVPTCLPGGDYIMRAEIIALHATMNPAQGTQFFVGCAQIRLEAGDNTVTELPPTVSIPGVYNENDPGLQWNIYEPSNRNKTYPIPGPAVLQCAPAPPRNGPY